MGWSEVAWAAVAPFWGIVGATVGYLMARSSRRPYQPKRIEAVCGCNHHRSFHKDGTGKCNHRNAYQTLDCGCQNYVGPKTYTEVMDEELDA